MPRVKYEGEAVEFGGLGRIEPQGQGTKTYLEGDYAGYRYEGDFLSDGHGHEHGRGRWYRPDNTLEYEGEWQQGNYHGSGTLREFEGDYAGYRYEGDFVEGSCHGQGRYYRPDGTLEYEGEWQQGEYHGQGRSYFDDGTTIEYEGDFAGSMRHGHGTLHDRDGSIRHCGRFADDEPVDDTTPSG